VRREQQQRRDQDIERRVPQHEANRTVQKRELRIDPVQLPLEPVKLRHEVLVFDHDRLHDTEIPAAMPADEGLVLDRLGAERAFHQVVNLPVEDWNATRVLARFA
jgi:hypothetical protein